MRRSKPLVAFVMMRRPIRLVACQPFLRNDAKRRLAALRVAGAFDLPVESGLCGGPNAAARLVSSAPGLFD
jgi:hypothetical protein